MIINSMTGYGKGIYEKNGQKVVVELKSVNHRFLDLNIKLPKGWIFAEDTIRKILKERLSRGHVDVFVFYEDNRQDKVKIDIDYELAKSYYNASLELSSTLGVTNNMGTYELIRIPDVTVIKQTEENQEILEELISQATNIAIDNLSKMRSTEGQLAMNDINEKLEEIDNLVIGIENNSGNMVAEHRTKVDERIREFLKGVEIDENRLLNEIAFYTDKVCIDEEITRLKSHLVHIKEIIVKGGVVGKQLDFIIQEMNRETNTIGSKCCDIKIANSVLALKSIIEKIREQTQNIE